MLGPHAITIRRAGTKAADYGNTTTLDWSTVTETSVSGCSVQPSQAPENTIDRDNVASRWTVWAPSDTDVTAVDRVVYDGDVYDVDGDPQRWGFAPLDHLVFNLRRSQG